MKGRTFQIGTVVLSIDVPSEISAGDRTNEQISRELFRMVDSRRLPASWAPMAPGQFSLNDQLAAPNTRHDLALIGDDTWIGKAAGRTKFARELAARVDAAHAENITVAAIALQGTELDDHLDLLVRHRVGMIRGPRRSGGSLQPQSIRFGVWYSPVSIVVPQPHQWSLFGANRSLRQTVRRAIRSAGVAHVVIDAARIAENHTSLGELDLVLAHLQRQRDKGVLNVTSLSGLTATLAQQPRVKKATSILRAA